MRGSASSRSCFSASRTSHKRSSDSPRRSSSIASSNRSAERLVHAVDLDQVAAGVVEDRGRDRTHLEGLLREPNPELLETLELRFRILDGERGERNAIALQRPLEWRHCRVTARLENELGTVRRLS